MSPSWLYADDADRARMVEMDRRLRPARRVTMAILAIALVASAPWLGWWTLIPLGVAAITYRLLEPVIDRTRRPEWVLLFAWGSSQLILASAIALAGGHAWLLLPWMALPVVTLGIRFTGRAVALGIGLTVALMFAIGFGVYAEAVLAEPPRLIAPLTLVIALGALQRVITMTDIDTRARALVDPLTGLLNRDALRSRVLEIEQLAAVSSEPVAVLVGDLDRFKQVNDEYGHAAGDQVLATVGHLLRAEMRAFDLVYRYGGEEFVILMPGAGEKQAAIKAERLRRRIANHRFGHGVEVTISFGFAVAAPDAGFDYEAVFEQADAALYAAKGAGRDTIRPEVAAEDGAGEEIREVPSAIATIRRAESAAALPGRE